MTNKQIAAALREMALYAKVPAFIYLPDDAFVAVEDYWHCERSWVTSDTEERMYLLFIAESLS